MFFVVVVVVVVMSASSRGREEAGVELETRDGSHSTEFLLLGNSTHSY